MADEAKQTEAAIRNKRKEREMVYGNAARVDNRGKNREKKRKNENIK